MALLFAILALLLAANQVEAAGESPTGIIIFTPNDHGSDEIAIAVPFVKAEQFPQVTNITTAEGKVIRVTNHRLKEVVRPTDLARATVVDEKGLQSLEAEVRSIRLLQERYPRTKDELEEPANQLERMVQVLQSGNVLFRGRLIPKVDYENQLAATRGKTTDFTLEGKSYRDAKISSIQGARISIGHSGGVATINVNLLSDEQIARLNETSEHLTIEKTDTLNKLHENASDVAPPNSAAENPVEPPALAVSPSPVHAPLPPISLTRVRQLLRDCHSELDTIQEGIKAMADLETFPGGRYGPMKYDEAMREARLQEARMDAALEAQDDLMSLLSTLGRGRIDDPSVPDEIHLRIAKLASSEKQSLEGITGILWMTGEVSGLLAALEEVAPEKAAPAQDSQEDPDTKATLIDTSTGQQSLDRESASESSMDSASVGSMPPSMPLPRQAGGSFPTWALILIAALLSAVAGGAGFLASHKQSKGRDLAEVCPHCEVNVEIARSNEEAVISCPACHQDFAVSPGPSNSVEGPSRPAVNHGRIALLYGAVAVASAVLVFGTILLIRNSLSGPADRSRYVLTDYPPELFDLRRRAEKGDIDAQVELARLHERGSEHLPVDPEEAAVWFLVAAKQDDPAAQLAMGTLCAMGHGTALDPNEAEYWLTRAAEQGLVEAQKFLAILYLGKGSLPYQPERSIQWMTRAAEGGDGEAQFHLSVAYHKGEGVEVDLEESERWLQRAVASGYEPALSIVRSRDSQIERQIESMWQQAADSLPVDTGFYTHPTNQYVPPQYREAQRRAEEAIRAQQGSTYR